MEKTTKDVLTEDDVKPVGIIKDRGDGIGIDREGKMFLMSYGYPTKVDEGKVLTSTYLSGAK